MIPQVVSQRVCVAGPNGEVEVKVTLEFDPPLPLVPEMFDLPVKRELQNAIVRLVEQARK